MLGAHVRAKGEKAMLKQYEGGVCSPDGSITPLQEPVSWRQARMAKVCGDKLFVLCIRPAGEPGWLYCSDLDSVVDMLVEGEPGDEWEMKWTLMTQAEVDAMPEHDGW